MIRHASFTLGLLLVLAASAPAQGVSERQSSYSGPGYGPSPYSLFMSSVNYPGTYGGHVQGVTPYQYFPSDMKPYSSPGHAPAAPGIFLSSINYPGVYGNYVQGVTPYLYYNQFYNSDITRYAGPANDRPGIFMTSLNYPGIYGSYAQGVTPFTAKYSTDLRPYAPPAPLDRPASSGVAVERPEQQAAYVDIRVPLDASLWVQGMKMSQVGTLRRFVSPPLVAGHEYNYAIRAAWMEGSQEMVQSRQVKVHPGDRVEVDFTTPSGGTATLRTRPLPIPQPR